VKAKDIFLLQSGFFDEQYLKSKQLTDNKGRSSKCKFLVGNLLKNFISIISLFSLSLCFRSFNYYRKKDREREREEEVKKVTNNFCRKCVQKSFQAICRSSYYTPEGNAEKLKKTLEQKSFLAFS